MAKMGDKVSARQSAIDAGLPIIPGTDRALTDAKDAYDFCAENGVPVMLKVRQRFSHSNKASNV